MSKIQEFAINFRYSFRPHKPVLIGRLVKTVVRSYVSKRPILRYVDFSVDFACNLKCKHCFAASLIQKNRRVLTLAEYRGIAKQCMKLGAVNFSFQGGEPLLFDRLPDIIRVFDPWRNVISVTTNATLLTEKKISELKKAGVDILTISLDSAIAAEHDDFRGVSGSFEKALSGVKLALKSGLSVTLGCVVTHQSLKREGFMALVRLAQGLKVLLYFILPVPAGRWENKDDMLLTEEDILFIEGLTKSSLYLRTDFQANLGGYGCGAVKEILYITPYGDVLPCPFLHISIGNVLEEPLSVIRGRGLKNAYFASYHDKCLASTDRDFIKNYLSKTFNRDKLPLKWEEVFTPKDNI